MRSDCVKKGAARAPHRSLFKGMGYIEEEINAPLIGVVTAKSEIVPGHMLLIRSQKLLRRVFVWLGEHLLKYQQSGYVMGLLWAMKA